VPPEDDVVSEPTYFATPRLYDMMYSEFRTDIAFHIAEARGLQGPVLEVCCGNGRLLVPLREAGLDIEGLDVDESMLADAKRKLDARTLETALHAADMRDFTLPRRYGYVYIPFNSFLHNLTQEDQLRTLRCCREHLAPDGMLTVMIFHPSATKLASFDGVPQLLKEVGSPDGGGRMRVWDGVKPDRVEQINNVERRVERLDDSGNLPETQRMQFQLRYIYKPEMELLLRLAGFGRWDAFTPFASYNGPAYEAPRAPEDGGIIAWHAWVT
jgi:SAM-dependent methyltransferase